MANTIQMPKRFDYSASSTFNSTLNNLLKPVGDATHIILDCRDLDYIDSAGIGLLVMAYKKAQAGNATVAITNLKPSAKEILLLANLQKLIDIK